MTVHVAREVSGYDPGHVAFLFSALDNARVSLTPQGLLWLAHLTCLALNTALQHVGFFPVLLLATVWLMTSR